MAAETTNTQAVGAEKPLLSVKDLNVSYGAIHAVQGISFDIHEGEIVTLIGANGAGKSTTLNTIAGLVKPDSGTITLDEKNLVGQRAHKIVEAGLALCPEGRRVFSRMSVAENLEMGGYTQSDSQNAKTVKMVVPASPSWRMIWKISSIRIGAKPMEGSSSIKSFGLLIRARPMASICCSPPDSVPAS